jgi:hypothetical protein
MSLNKFTDGSLSKSWMNINCNSLKINDVPVMSGSSISLTDDVYIQLPLGGVSNVFLASGPNCTIQDITGCVDGQVVNFTVCQQASSLTIQTGFRIKSSEGLTNIFIAGTGGNVVGCWSSSLGYMTIVGGVAPP